MGRDDSDELEPDDDVVTVAYEKFVRETDKAKLFRFEGDQEVWIPKSLIESEDPDDQAIEIPAWLARERDLNF